MKRPTMGQASLCSFVAHTAVLSGLLICSATPERQFSFDGRRNAVQVATLSAPSLAVPAEPMVEPPVETTIEIVPPAPQPEFEELMRKIVRRSPAPQRVDKLSPSSSRLEVARQQDQTLVARTRTTLKLEAVEADIQASANQDRAAAQLEPPKPELAQASRQAPQQERRVQASLAAPPSVQILASAGVNDRTPPDFSRNASPAYPAEAIRRRLEGTVLLELDVSATGRVENVTILRSSGHSILDQSAVNAVRSWRGRPALAANEPVATVESIPIRFRLND